MVAGIGLLLLPMVPFLGQNINGAQLWMAIGPLTFQPGELAKIALIIFFAGYLVNRKDSLAMVGRKVLGVHIPRARELGPILVIWVASLAVLVLQRDLGTSLLYFGLFLVMIYVATGRALYVVVGLGMFGTGALVASQVMDYVAGRFGAWLDPFSSERYDAIGGSYQLVQGLFGMAHGGLLGTGASDLARWWLSEPATAYSWVFGMEALMFAGSAWWAVQVGRGEAVQTRTTQTAPWAMEGQQP